MNHQIKRFFVAAAIACIVPAAAFASTARMTGLNVPGDYTKDYTGMFTYLSTVNSTGNLVYAEAGSMDGYYSNDDRGMGAVLPNLFDGKAGVWAIHMRTWDPALGQSWWGAPINGGGRFYDPNYNGNFQSFDIMWGHKLGSANLGLRLNRSFYSYDNGATTVEGKGNNGRNNLGFGAGVGFDINPNNSVEAALQFQSRTFDQGGTGALTDDGGSGYLFAARMWSKRSGSLTLVPAVKLWKLDQSTTDGTVSAKDELSGWQLGGAGNWAVGHDDLFVFGAQFIGNKQKQDTDEYTETLMPVLFMGLETHLNSWLTFRAGAQQSAFETWEHKDSSPGGVTTKESQSHFSFNMGTTVKIGNVQFDAVLDPAFLNNPFAQLMGGTNVAFDQYNYYDANRAAGGPNYGTAFPQVSLTYTW
jgi:hypothetical protein